MAKPATVQKLKHGKALCGKTFGGFVDTFNWLVDFCQSLQGDKDANNANGVISVDRSDPTAPVIRASPAHENGSGGGGGGDDGPEDEPLEPGADPDNPYEDPEDFPDDEDAIDADGNGISNDAGSLDGGGGDYCNSIFGGAADEPAGGNEISNTCSK
ncbi:MAG: hypothetical protein IJG13_12080 [Kiritimatiellae bacterium]|nr:hypothetical protein [Kiritimatiellia bacterium]